jgi:hypothetical protein
MWQIMSRVNLNQNQSPHLTMPFIHEELQQFYLHLNINNNTSQKLGYQDFHYFDGEHEHPQSRLIFPYFLSFSDDEMCFFI